MTLNKISRCALTDVSALILVLVIGVVFSITAHIPTAVTLLQVLIIELLTQAPILSALKHEKRSHRPRHAPSHQFIIEIVLFGALAAIITYLNYRFFFVRHGLSPAYIDTTHPLYLQATTVAYVTLALCQAANVVFIKSDEHKQFFTNKKLTRAAAISGIILLAVIYLPWLQAVFSTEALGFWDWTMVLVSVGAYSGARFVQRHTRQHTRHEVIKLHRKVHANR